MASMSVACILPSPWSSGVSRAPYRLLQPPKMSQRAEIGRSDGTLGTKVSVSIEANKSTVVGETLERRKLLLVSSIGFMFGTFQNALHNGVAVAAEFTDMPALRGKDYGKTKMRYPDYTETQSGLQYKVILGT